MDCKLSDINEGVLVCQCKVKGEYFYQRSLHKVNQRESIRRGELAILHIGHVELLKNITLIMSWA